MAFSDILKSVAPAITTALGGPLAGAAAEFLASKFGISDATQDKIQQVLSGTDPEKIKELDNSFKEFMARNGIALQLAQIDVNKAEAASTNWFVAGWRPAIGWTCGVAFAYSYILFPFIQFLAYTWGSADTVAQLAKLPALDLASMLPVLGGMLGLGGMRSYEKAQGVQNEH